MSLRDVADPWAAIENQDAFEEVLLLGIVSSLKSVAIGAMRFDFDYGKRIIGQFGQRCHIAHGDGLDRGEDGLGTTSLDTVPVVNRKNRRFDAARPSRLYRASQMLTDFQKSVDRSVSLSPAALCLSDAKDLPPSPSTKSRSSSFSRKTAVFSGNCSSWSRARRGLIDVSQALLAS